MQSQPECLVWIAHISCMRETPSLMKTATAGACTGFGGISGGALRLPVPSQGGDAACRRSV